jgi:SAM-dependent methyltransferase
MLQKEDALMPPSELNFVGKGDFLELGEGILRELIEFGGLNADDHVLDVGCGIGRAAIPLTGFLSEKGRYDGFDIVPAGITWCTENITKKYANFKFKLANVYNKVYHPSGSHRADEYTFPYPDDSFDFVFLVSVFTHMLPPGLENYLSEICRVMKRDGRCYISYFLFDGETERLIKSKKTHNISFAHRIDQHHFIMSRQQPEMAVCYEENYLRSLYRENALEFDGPIIFGNWCERSGDSEVYQDIITATKLWHDHERNSLLRQQRQARLLRPSSIWRGGISQGWQLLPRPLKSIVRNRLKAGWAGSQ